MNKVLKSCLLALSVLVISGCGGGASTSELPSWYLNPPPSNPIVFHGVGEASTKEASRANALATIGGQISTNVSSSLEMSTNVHNDKVSKDVEERTKTTIETIKFTGVKVLEVKHNAGTFYTHLTVNRSVLLQAQKKQVDIKYNKLNSVFKRVKANNIFELIQNKSTIDASVIEIRGRLPVLKAISADFDDASYAKNLDNISNETRNAAKKAMVRVTTSKGAKEFGEVVKKYVSSYGMTLVSNSSSVKNKKNLLLVNVSKSSSPKTVRTTDPRLKGASFADVIVTLTTKTSTNKVIAQNRIKVVNISKDGYKAASAKTQKFEREIKKKGIVNILLEK